MSVNRNTLLTLTCSTAPSPHLPYTTEHAPTALRATRKETLGTWKHIDALRAKTLEHLQDALTTTKRLFTLTGKNFAVDDHIPVLTANLYKTITGQQNPTPTHQDSPISEALRSLTKEVKRIAVKVDQQQPPRNQSPNPGLSTSIHNLENARPMPTLLQARRLTNPQPPLPGPKPWPTQARLTIQCFWPLSLTPPYPPDSRRNEATIVQNINISLTSQGTLSDLKIIAIKWNIQGNCIAFTRIATIQWTLFNNVTPYHKINYLLVCNI